MNRWLCLAALGTGLSQAQSIQIPLRVTVEDACEVHSQSSVALVLKCTRGAAPLPDPRGIAGVRLQLWHLSGHSSNGGAQLLTYQALSAPSNETVFF